jgi:hypothetical protein
MLEVSHVDENATEAACGGAARRRPRAGRGQPSGGAQASTTLATRAKGTRNAFMVTDGWGRSPRGGFASLYGGGRAEGRTKVYFAIHRCGCRDRHIVDGLV